MLSPRLETILELIPEETTRLLDVGCDHGYLSLAYLREHPAGQAVLSDKREGPLSRARENLAAYARAGRASLVLADGLSEWQPEDGDTIVIAGMGGGEIQSILLDLIDSGKTALYADVQFTLILQVMRHQAKVRAMLNHLELVDQRLTRDRGWLYCVDKYQGTLADLAALTPVERTHEIKDWIGSLLLETDGVDQAAYLRRQLKIAGSEIRSLLPEEQPLRQRLLDDLKDKLEADKSLTDEQDGS